MNDLRVALRTLRKYPAFFLTVVTVLALGIGGTSVIFAVVNAVLLRPLPLPHPSELVRVFSGRSGGERWTMSPPDFTDVRKDNRVFTEVAAMNEQSFALTGDGPAEQISGTSVTGGFFDVLNVQPLLGRTITPGSDANGSPDIAVIGYGLWQRRFGGDSAVVGRRATFDGVSYEIVGVMPRGFDYPDHSDVWLPQRFSVNDLTTQRGAHYLDVIARRRAGVSLAAANADLGRIARNLAAAYPRTNKDESAVAATLRDAMVGNVRAPLFILLAAVAVVLLIACANVAGLLLVRAVGREREVAIRTALGAGRARLIRGFLIESLTIALIAGGLGVLFAVWGTALLAGLTSDGIPLIASTRVDGTVLLFAVAVTLGTVLLFGLLPALHSAALGRLADRLKAEGRGVAAGRGRTRAALVVAETALAVVLLAGAGLLVRSFYRLEHVNPGFNPAHVLTFGVSLPDAAYPKPALADQFYHQLIDRVDAIPGVETAGAIFGMPFTGFGYSISALTVDGRTLPHDEQEALSVQVRVVTPQFFPAMGIPIRRGRGIEATDRSGAPPVIVINTAAAKRIWHGEDPLGHTFVIGTRLGLGGGYAGGTVVGVIGDIKSGSLHETTAPTIYLSHAQFPTGFMGVAVRTDGDPLGLTKVVQAALAATDPNVPMFHVRSMEQLVDASVARPRLYASLLALFSLVAVLLAAIGLYGVLAQSVAQRARELGIRMALGAPAREVVRLVIAQASRLAGLGVVIGVAVALVVSKALASLLFGVSPRDPATLVSVAVMLFIVALVASWIPARRAGRVEPMAVLRDE